MSTSSRPVVVNSTSVVSGATQPDGTLPLIAFNTSAQYPLKLSSTNYAAWSFQIHTLLIGYDLYGFLDDTRPCPPATITSENSSTAVTNPLYTYWIRQDHLILSAIIGSIEPSLIPFIAAAKTARYAWDILSATYGKPTQGCILTLKTHLHNPKKGDRSSPNTCLKSKVGLMN